MAALKKNKLKLTATAALLFFHINLLGKGLSLVKNAPKPMAKWHYYASWSWSRQYCKESNLRDPSLKQNAKQVNPN